MSEIPQKGERFEVRDSRVHGRGVFALERIRKGARVAQYRGEIITKRESLVRQEGGNEYIFNLDDEHDLDGAVEWNPARFVNHSCAPNCEALLEDREIWLVALREIQPGEELSFNYGYSLEDYQEHPCRCGAKRCVGYIVAEEFWGSVRSGRKEEAVPR